MNIEELVRLGKQNPAEAHKLVARTVGLKGHRAFFEFRGRQACIEKAMLKPLPGNSADAFLNGNLKVNNRTVYEVVPTHIKCLQALDSPLLKMGQEAAENKDKSANADLTEEQQWELCCIFTTPPKQLRTMLKEKGASSIRKLAEDEWSERSASEINITVMAVINQYARHFQTTVKFAAEMEASGDVSFFRELRERVLKPQESAGSSAMSAATENTTQLKQ